MSLSVSSEMKKMNKWCDLPDDCWEMIFELLGHHSNLEPLSLVCKSFLSISNRIRTHFTMAEPTFLIHGTLSPFLARFRNLTSISLVRFRGDLNQSLLQIAASGLKIETLDISSNASFPTDGLALLGKNIRVLICSRVHMFGDQELAFIADSFPLLEELDISYPFNPSSSAVITETGIEHFASRVTKKLRKLDISGIYCIGGRSILAIFSNCVHLSEFKLYHFHDITHSVFQFFAKKSSTDSNQISPSLVPRNQLYGAFSSLHLSGVLLTDESLINIANAGFPLKKLTLQAYNSSSNSFTFSGLSILLKTYHSLDCLALNGLNFLDDSLMAVLSAYFRCLSKIELSRCLNLSYSSLFLLILNCPFLEDIHMRIDKRKRNLSKTSVVNPRIKSLHLKDSDGLDDQCLITLSSICPKLERLDVSSCPLIRNRGLERILNKCTQISHLDINFCQKITSIGRGGILKNLKFINVGWMETDSIMLTMIGTRCSELEELSMTWCKKITGDGFMEITRNCKKLKCIRMSSSNVSQESLDWIVSSIPSLTMVYPPSGHPFAFDSKRSKLFLNF